jgi:hypothetical protein
VDRWHLATQELVSGSVERLVLKVREAVKWREDQERSSKWDRWRRSKDLVNSGARRVRAQPLGTSSHEEARRKEVDSRWIWIAEGPLDPHMGSYIGASQEKA